MTPRKIIFDENIFPEKTSKQINGGAALDDRKSSKLTSLKRYWKTASDDLGLDNFE